MKNTKMKNIIGFFMITVALMIMGCKETPAEKEVIIVPAKTVVVEKDAPAKSTSISLDKKGVELKSEELDVKIKND
ncbi:MAG: hypothetical protein Q8K04_11985 [Lutibacter sp.]|nr:hypothetical protein [Lutibacter sp.]MDP3946128.1 hypothetical protein [Lutibacter sp.]